MILAEPDALLTGSSKDARAGRGEDVQVPWQHDLPAGRSGSSPRRFVPCRPIRPACDVPIRGSGEVARCGSSIRFIAMMRLATGFSRAVEAHIGCLDCKQPVVEAVLSEQAVMRERAQPYVDDPTLVRNIIADGCERARKLAQGNHAGRTRGDGARLRLTAVDPIGPFGFRQCNARMNLPRSRPVETPAQLAAVGVCMASPEFSRSLHPAGRALEIIPDAFEGRSICCFYLIRRANLERSDIPMAPLTAQYLVYVEAMRASNLELAAEYLLMAAMLLEIKSRLLLPRPASGSSDDEVDPRARTVTLALSSEQTKLAAAKLDAMPGVDRTSNGSACRGGKVNERQPRSASTTCNAWLRMVKEGATDQHHRVDREELVRWKHMTAIMRCRAVISWCSIRCLDPSIGVPALVVVMVEP